MSQEKWIKLRNEDGQFFDSRLGFSLVGDERKPRPDPLPSDSLTARRISAGGLVECDPPAPVGVKSPHPDPLPEREGEAEEAVEEQCVWGHADGWSTVNPDGSFGVPDPNERYEIPQPEPPAPLAPQPEAAPAEEEVPATVEELAGARDTVIERRIETLLAEHKRAELREMAKALGLSIKATAKNRTIAAEIAVAEWQREHGM